MLHNGNGGEVEISRRVVVLDVYNANGSLRTNSSETTTFVGGEGVQQQRIKGNSSSVYTSTVTTSGTCSGSVSRNLNDVSCSGSTDALKVNGHPKTITASNNNSLPSDFVTVLRVDDTPEKLRETSRRVEEQSFVTILQVNEMMRNNCQTIATNGGTSRTVVETVTIYRLPGERLGMALKFEGGDANTSAPVSKVLIQSIQPDSPAARAESTGGILGNLQEGDTILDIDGREVTSLTRLDCVSLLRDASVCIKLKVKREIRTYEESIRSSNEDLRVEDDRPQLPAKKKGTPPPIPPRKTACLSHSPTLNNSFPKSFEMDFASIEGVKEKIQRLECVGQTSAQIQPTEKVLKRPSHPPPLPPRRPRTGSESNPTSDTEENSEKTPTFPGGSLSMRLPGWEELMARRAESQCQQLPVQPNVYVDLFAEEDDKRGIESESDDTGSSVSTVIEKFSRGSTANSSFSEIHHGTGPQFDLKQVLSPFEQLERELDEAAQTMVDGQETNTLREKSVHQNDITILPPESFQDCAFDSSSFYKITSSPISPPGDSGFADDLDDEDDVNKSPNSHLVFPPNFPNSKSTRNDSTDNEEFVDTPPPETNDIENSPLGNSEQDNEVFVDDPLDMVATPEKAPEKPEIVSEDENEEFVDGPVDVEPMEKEPVKTGRKTKPSDQPPAVPQKREVPKPPPVPPRLSIPKSPNKEDKSLAKNNSIIPPKIPDSKERPRSAKVIPTSLIEPQVIGAIEKKQPTILNQSPDRSRRTKDGGGQPLRPKTPETVKMRSKSGGASSGHRRPKSLILAENSNKMVAEHQTRRPRSLSLEDAEATLMSRLQEIASPPSNSAFPSKIPRPTFLTSPMDRGHLNFFAERSSSASVSRSNSMSSIDREPTSLPLSLNSDRRVVLSRSESLRSVEATETTVTKVIKGKDNNVIQQNTVTEAKGNETRSVRAASSRFGFVEKTEGRRVNFTSRSSVTSSRQNSSPKNETKSTETKRKLVRSHSAQGELGHQRNKEDTSVNTTTESPKNRKKDNTTKDQETKAMATKEKEIVKSSPEPLKKTSTTATSSSTIATALENDSSSKANKGTAKDMNTQDVSNGNSDDLSGIESSNFEDKDEAVKKTDEEVNAKEEKTNPSRLEEHEDVNQHPNQNPQTHDDDVQVQIAQDSSDPVPPKGIDLQMNREIHGNESNLNNTEELRNAIEDIPNEPERPPTIITTSSHYQHRESTVEVINPAFEELQLNFGDSWCVGNAFHLARQAEEQGEILVLAPSSDDSPPNSFSLLDDVLKTEEDALQFRVEVGLPENHGGVTSEIIELQPGQNLGFYNQTSNGGDPFAGDNACKNAYTAWSLSRWPLQDVPEEDEELEEEVVQESDGNNSPAEPLSPKEENILETEGHGQNEEVVCDESPSNVTRDLKSDKVTSSQGGNDELTTKIPERPVAEGQSPVSSEKPSLVDEQVEGNQDDLSLEKEDNLQQSVEDLDFDGERSKEHGQSGDEMDIYFSGPPSYGVNQHQVTIDSSSKTSPLPPPPTYSRAPPDGHEFPPNYSEPEAPPPPSSLPPKMPVNGDILSMGEKATLVRESSSTSLSRSFSLSSPPEYLTHRDGGKSYKETVAFHNQKNQVASVPGKLVNGTNNSRWNSEECLSKRQSVKNGGTSTTHGGRYSSRRENEKPPSIRDRIALFSQPDEQAAKPTSGNVNQTIATSTKTINLSTPPTRSGLLISSTNKLDEDTNGYGKINGTDSESLIKSSITMEKPLVLKPKNDPGEVFASKFIKNQPDVPSVPPPTLPARRESSPYISNYPQTQLSRMRFSYGSGQKSDDVGSRRSSLGSFPPPYLESRRQSATKLKGLVIPDKANFVPTTENRLPTIIRSSTVSSNFSNTFQAKSDSVLVETAKPSMAVSLDSKYPRVSELQKEHQPAFKSHSLDLSKTSLSTPSVAATVSSSSLSSLTAVTSLGTTSNGTKQSTFQFSLSHSKPVTPTLPEKPILVSPTPPPSSYLGNNSAVVLDTVEKTITKTSTEAAIPPPLPATRPPVITSTVAIEPPILSTKDANQNSIDNYAYKQTNQEKAPPLIKSSTPQVSSTTTNRSALDRLDSLVLTSHKSNDDGITNKLENRNDSVNNNSTTNAITNKNGGGVGSVNINNNINTNLTRHQNTYVEQVITREDIMAIASNGGAVTPDFMSCGSSVFSNSSTNDSRLWSIRPSESDDDTNSVISLRTEDSRQTADDSLSDATTDSLDRLNSDLKPRRLSQQKTVLRARVDSADSVKNFRALAERWEMRAGDSTQDSSARSTPSGPPPAVSSLPLTRRDSGRSTSSSAADVKLPPSLLPRNGLETPDKPSSPTGRIPRESRSFSVTNESWTSSSSPPASLKDKLESSLMDNKNHARKSATLERSASTFTLDHSINESSSFDATNNKVNRAVSYAGIGKSSRSISVSDIRRTFESQMKTESTTPPKISEPEIQERSGHIAIKRESLSSYSSSPSTTGSGKDIRNSSNLFPASTEIHHKRFSSMDSTASDSGVSTPAHYGSTSSLAAPSSGSREHFGSVTSLASTSSLISPQELQQLIEEANQSLNEELSSSGGSCAGHEISVVVLHKDNLTGSIGITLAGGADYETKEITIHKIIAGSLADRDDRLRKGDRILSINGKNLRGVSHREALEILKSPRQEVVLVISRERMVPGSPGSNLSSSMESVRQSNETLTTIPSSQTISSRTERAVSLPAQSRLTSTLTSVTETKVMSTRANGTTESSQRVSVENTTGNGNHVIIQLVKDGTGLGFSLEGGKDSPFGDKPLIVKRVFKGGAADREGTLKGTDEIVSVNHLSVSNMTRTEAWNFMKKLPDGPVSIIVRKS